VYGEDGYLESVTDHVGPFVYMDDSLAYCIVDEGRILFDGSDYRYEYHLKDHLGNVRVCFADSAGVPVVTQENHYYPFGLAINGLSYDRPEGTEEQNPYRYNGKPFHPENGLNWYNYGARFYDPQVGRWWSVDPMAENNVNVSPYDFVGGNPISRVDLFGLDWYKDENTGATLWVDSQDETYDKDGITYTNIGNTYNTEIGGVWFNFYQNYHVKSTDEKVDVQEMVYNDPQLFRTLFNTLDEKYASELFYDSYAYSINQAGKFWEEWL